jgi:site-specific recombinase XerC
MTADNCPSRSLIVRPKAAVSTDIALELADAAAYAEAEKSAATRRAYRSDFNLFCAWCESKRAPALPASPATVAAFLAAQANGGTKASTINRRLAAIRYAHKSAGHESPNTSEAVKATLRGIRRVIGTAPLRKKPATADRIRVMAEATDRSIKGVRDRAILLLGFAGAFRRSEDYHAYFSFFVEAPVFGCSRRHDERSKYFAGVEIFLLHSGTNDFLGK